MLSAETLLALRKSLVAVFVKPELVKYAVEIVRSTRINPSILTGAGPRATQALILSTLAYAAVNGRDYVIPDDIRKMAVPVLEHRLIL